MLNLGAYFAFAYHLGRVFCGNRERPADWRGRFTTFA
ncbi:ABC-2 transporter family protein, partial [Vibrio parahaemolyticus V-223/04]